MKQIPVASASGMFTKFNVTRVIRTSELNNNGLMRALDTLKADQIHNMLSLAVVDKAQKKNGGRLQQQNILKGVLIGSDYFESAKTAFPGVVPFIKETRLTDDFLVPEDRFGRLLSRIGPEQERRMTVTAVGVGGLVSLGVPFEDASLAVEPNTIVPTLVDGAAGEVTFPLGEVGEKVSLSYVTQALHPIFTIHRHAKQPVSLNLYIKDEVHAVLMSTTLAALLGIGLPAY